MGLMKCPDCGAERTDQLVDRPGDFWHRDVRRPGCPNCGSERGEVQDGKTVVIGIIVGIVALAFAFWAVDWWFYIMDTIWGALTFR